MLQMADFRSNTSLQVFSCDPTFCDKVSVQININMILQSLIYCYKYMTLTTNNIRLTKGSLTVSPDDLSL